MKKSILIFGLIVLVGLAAMCATPGSHQQPVKTPSPEPSNNKVPKSKIVFASTP